MNRKSAKAFPESPRPGREPEDPAGNTNRSSSSAREPSAAAGDRSRRAMHTQGLRPGLVALGLLFLGIAAADPLDEQLAAVRTIHVEPLGGADAGAIGDLLVAAIHRSRLFVLTENPDAADAFLRGSAEDLIYQDYQRYRASLTARGGVSASRRESGESQANASNFGVGDMEESTRRERAHEALAAVRLVLRDGTVVWAAAHESNGAKFKGAAADVADKAADDLARAVREARTRTPNAAADTLGGSSSRSSP
jgi:hypothetical protein